MSIQPGSSKLAGRHSVPEIQKKQKSQIKKILLQLLNYQGALSVGYHRQYSFYRCRLFTAYEKNGKYEDYFYLSDRNLQVKVDIYDKDNNLINSLVILDGREIGVDVLDSYKYQISLVGDNVKEVEGYGKVICDYIKGIPILKQYTLGFCQRTHKDIEIVEERIIKVDWENPDFDLKEFFENNEEIARSFFPHKFQGSGTVLGKDNCLMSMPLPIIPDLPETSETTETTESTETPSTEEPSTETPSIEEPSTETPTPTPEPVKPVEPTPTTETTTITEDRGKVDPSEKNEMVQTGDLATNTYYGGYFLVTAFGVLTAFFKKFKK